MITGLNQVGPSLPGISDSPKDKKNEPSVDNSKKKSGSDSFMDVLKTNSTKREEPQRGRAAGREANPKKDTMFSKNEDKVAVKTEPRMAPEDNTSREETRTVREKKSDNSRVGKKNSDSESDREQAMLNFMDSMESDFGVPPQRVAEAMANLPDDELNSSPEESAPHVISQLNLQPEDQQKALQMYMSFLQKLPSAQPSQEAEAAQTPAQTAGAAAALSMKTPSLQERREKLNQTLDQMNSKFFMKSQSSESFQRSGEPAMTKESSMEMSGTLTDLNRDNSLKDANALQSKEGFDPRKYGMTPVQPRPDQTINPREANMQAMNAQAMNAEALRRQALQAQSPEEMNQEEADKSALMQKLAALGAAAGAIDKGIQNDPQNAQALKAEQALQQMQGQQNANQNLMGAMAVNGAGKAAWSQGDENLDDQKNDPKDSLSNSSLSSLGANHQAASKDLPALSSDAGFAGAMTAANKGQNAENNPNIRQIMNQAQYMIKKGGGEAKIQLNPEGLGEIHMKVAVRDGKVDLQIATQTKEAKKLVESSMHELRDSFAHRNLGMEAVKVDVGAHLAGDKHHSDQQTQDQSQQRQLDLKQDMSRDQSKSQAREFWNQFNDDSGFSRRGALMDSPGIRAYGGGRRNDPLQPATSGSVSSESRRYVQSGKGRGIDVVA